MEIDASAAGDASMKRICLVFVVFWSLSASVWGQKPGEEWDPAGKSLSELIAVIRQPARTFDRPRAAEAAAEYGRNAVEPLCGLLLEEQFMVRSYALLGLSRMGAEAEAAVPALVRIVADSQDELRGQAIDVLGMIGPAADEAVPMLIRVMEQSRGELQQSVLRSLTRIGSPAAVQAIENAFQRGDVTFRRMSLKTLQNTPDAAANLVPMLINVYRCGDPAINGDLLVLMSVIGEPVVESLVELLGAEQAESRRRAALALSRHRLASASAVPALMTALTDSEPVVRFWAVKALGAIGDPARTAATPLMACLNDSDADVRWQAIRSIERLGLESQAAEKLEGLRSDPHPTVRRAAEQLLQSSSPSPR
jgi:HEAT repeat protein